MLSAAWAYPVESITSVNGALDAISRSIEHVASFGDRVVMENPGFPPFFDLLKLLGRMRDLPGVQSTETFMYLKLLKQRYDWGTR